MPTDRHAKPETFHPHLAATQASPVTHTENLPALPTPLIGRAQELAYLRGQVIGGDARLLTVLGPPGVGKTRLALEVAHTSIDRFAGGVLFVDLTPIRDPALIIYALGHTLGVREGWESGAPLDLPVERVKDALRHRDLLLVIDNFEHVVEGAPIVGELLGACPRLKVLATSREPLHLQWEQQFPLGPLPLPDLEPLPSVEALIHNPAVAMFVTRARAVVPDFALAEHNARSVAEICVRLDGLPLAIELVVARVRTVPLPTIVAQLSRRLEFLTGGRRDLPARQRALRSAIAWSYELLPATEQGLFRRLAVFAGGAGAEAIQSVCSEAVDLTVDVHTLSALVDKNLLLWATLPDGSTRYRMLESLREFAWEQAQAKSELDAMLARHARFFLELAGAADSELVGPNEAVWHERLEREHDNLRLALEWALNADIEAAVRSVGALRRFWNVRGHWGEGRSWVERALEKGGATVSPAARAKALYAAAVLAHQQSDLETATRRTEEYVTVNKALGNKAGMAEGFWYLGNLARRRNDLAGAASLYEQSFRIAREAGDKKKMAGALQSMGKVALVQGDLPRARALLQEALALAQETGEYRATIGALLGLGQTALDGGDAGEAEGAFTEALSEARRHGDRFEIAESLEYLGYASERRGDLRKADTLLGDSLAIYRELGDDGSAALILRYMGGIAVRGGDTRRGAELIEQSLVLNRDLRDLVGIARTLDAAGVLAAQHGPPGEAAILLGIATQLRETGSGPRERAEQQAFDAALLQLQEKLPEEFASVWAGGAAISVEDAIERALAVLHNLSVRPVVSERQKAEGPLSHREAEIARLVAQGLSNREIGKHLFISERTVASHIEHILNKLGFRSRAQIAAWAVSRGLQTPEQ